MSSVKHAPIKFSNRNQTAPSVERTFPNSKSSPSNPYTLRPPDGELPATLPADLPAEPVAAVVDLPDLQAVAAVVAVADLPYLPAVVMLSPGS